MFSRVAEERSKRYVPASSQLPPHLVSRPSRAGLSGTLAAVMILRFAICGTVSMVKCLNAGAIPAPNLSEPVPHRETAASGPVLAAPAAGLRRIPWRSGCRVELINDSDPAITGESSEERPVTPHGERPGRTERVGPVTASEQAVVRWSRGIETSRPTSPTDGKRGGTAVDPSRIRRPRGTGQHLPTQPRPGEP